MSNSASQNNALFWCSEKQLEFQANKAINGYYKEVSKGSTGKIFPYPLESIAPQFDPFIYRNNLYEDPIEIKDPRPLTTNNSYTFIIPYFHEEDSKLWFEGIFSMLANLHSNDGIFIYEIIAVRLKVHIQFCVQNKYVEQSKDVLKSEFSNTEFLVTEQNDFLQKAINQVKTESFFINAYYPQPPYYRNFISAQSKNSSILNLLLQALKNLEEGELFYYRAIIESAKDDWDKNCLNTHTYERRNFSLYDLNLIKWYLPPSSEAKKAINDKLLPEHSPFYFVQPLIAFFGDSKKFNSIKSFISSYRFGEYPYSIVNQDDFINKLGKEKPLDFIKNRNTHLQGHLLNRYETTFFIPFPCENCIANYSKALQTLAARPIPKELQEKGIVIGVQDFMEEKVKLCLPLNHIQHSFVLIGNQGFGKTNELLNILSQFETMNNKRFSIIIFYFHDLEFVINTISHIPERRLKDVILAMPSLRGKVLGKNLVDGIDVSNPAKKASDLAYALENCSATFGVDVKFLIKNLFHTLILSENSAFDHVLNILENNDPIGRIKRNEVRRKTSNQMIHKFLDIMENKSSDAKKIQNKLQDFFDEESIAQMCAYAGPDLISYKDIIEKGKILIWYLGGLGTAGNAIASMEVSRIHQHFLDYGKELTKPYFPTIVAVDEAQRIKAKGICDSIREDRKHGLSYILSTQTLQGVDTALKEGIDLIASSGYFQCTENDAKYFSQKTGGYVKPKDIMALDKYEMFVRVLSSKNVYKCKTTEFIPGDKNKFDFVVNNCLQKYYVDQNEQFEIRKEKEKSLLQGGRPKAVKQKLSNLSDEFKKLINPE